VSFFFQAEDGIRDKLATGVQTCALPISSNRWGSPTGSQYRVSWMMMVSLRGVLMASPCRGSQGDSRQPDSGLLVLDSAGLIGRRSEERRVGKECRCGLAGSPPEEESARA